MRLVNSPYSLFDLSVTPLRLTKAIHASLKKLVRIRWSWSLEKLMNAQGEGVTVSAQYRERLYRLGQMVFAVYR